MPEETLTAKVTVVNKLGMHLRPADMFARTAAKFKAQIRVSKSNQGIDGRSIVELLMLSARRGTELTISATGEEAATALQSLVKLVEDGFGEMEGLDQ